MKKSISKQVFEEESERNISLLWEGRRFFVVVVFANSPFSPIHEVDVVLARTAGEPMEGRLS